MRGNTPLIVAAAQGNVKRLGVLIKAGALLDLQENGGHTALMCAAMRGEKGAVLLLLSSGANRDIVNNDGKTAVQLARENEQAAAMAQYQMTDRPWESRQEEIAKIIERKTLPAQNIIGVLLRIFPSLK